MLKHSTRQLIESFRYRRLAYLQKPSRCWENISMTQRENAALWQRLDRKRMGAKSVRDSERKALDYRKHLAELNHA